MPKNALTVSLLAILLVGAAGARGAVAVEEQATAQDVEQARRCASETRAASHAFDDVRDSVRAGDNTRAKSQLDQAEDFLGSARSACRYDADVMAQLELLSGEASGLRRALSR
ncbi:MAG TPA: hypothetical protein VGK20_11910 [Candidatus Binatia bacterium]